MPSGLLEVNLQSARGLKAGDFFSKSDPYVLIKCGSIEKKSNVARNKGSNPTWDQTFTFHLQEGTTNLLLKVMDEDRFTRDDELGLVTVPLDEVFRCGSTEMKPYPVELPNGKYKGEVKISLSFKQPGKPSDGANPSPNNQIDLDKCLPSIRGPYGSSNAGGWSKGVTH